MSDRAFEYLKDFIFIAISSALLVLSYPKFDLGILAWIGLIPLLLAIREKPPAAGFVFSTICGILFFLGVFHWILEIKGYTGFHHALLAVYLGSYFGLIFCFIGRRRGPGWALFAAPFIWVCLEFIRSHFLFLALPWGLLGHTQYQYPLVIQIAAITGTYGISFWVVLVNAVLASWVFPLVRHWIPVQKSPEVSLDARPHRALLIYTAIFTVLTLIYGPEFKPSYEDSPSHR